MAKASGGRKNAGRSPKARTSQIDDVFAKYPARPDAGPPEIVDPRWLLKAAAVAIGGALLCAYGTLCLIVYQGQWQLVLHPVTGPMAAVAGGQELRFGAGETGQPQLAGVWMPAAASGATASGAAATILYLPDGSGNLAQDAAALQQLHGLPVNVFAFDYRGFGASAGAPHPDEARMKEDAESAFTYLVNTLHVPASRIVPYGVGLGGALAAGLAARHGEVPAVVLEEPRANATGEALADSRSRLVPLGMFFHERFDLAGPLGELKTPKLLLEAGPSHSPVASAAQFTALGHAAASPAMMVHLKPSDGEKEKIWRASVLRFLDEYLPIPPSGFGSGD